MSVAQLRACKCCLQQLWRYNTHAVEMRIQYLNSLTGAGKESQTIMVDDIPGVNKVVQWSMYICAEYFTATAH